MADPLDLTDLNPEYHRRLNVFLADAAAAGIPAHVISGYRNNDLQAKLYANYQAKQAGRPLPYPEEGSGSRAAPPGDSYHNFGFAADVLANDPNRQNDLINLANSNPKYGIHALGGADPPHFQIAGSLQEARAQYGDGGGGETPSYAFTLPANAPMGMGNNNPLNLKYYQGAEKDYSGLIGPSANTDQGTPQMKFASQEAGWAAAYKLAMQKYNNGRETPLAMISNEGGWTPGNPVAAANIAKTLGIGLNDDLNLHDPASALKFMRAMVTQEQGQAGSAYPDAMIAAAIAGKTGPPAGAGGAVAGAAAPTAAAAAAPYYAPPSPQAIMGQSIGQALSGMSGGFSSTASGNMEDPPDQPAIRSMAAETDFTAPPASAVPAQYAGGIGGAGIGSQLGALAAQPNPSMLENPQNAPSITQGAPSMTSMLGDLGTTATPGMFDNRGGNPLSPNPYRRTMRLA